jgi:glycyl-tRNA synthetase
VIEPTFGVDRTCLTLLVDAYDEEEILDVNGKVDTRVVLRLHPRVAPYKAAVLPLLKKPELTQPSWNLFQTLSAMSGVLVDYDETGNIGKRYRRHDEIGTPFCFTIDFETLDDRSVTVRHRDDMSQERIAIDAVPEWLAERLA